MKKFIIPVVIVAIAAIAAIIYFSGDKSVKAKPIDADFALYINGKQLLEKSALLEQFNESQRKTMGISIASEMNCPEQTDYIQTLAVNLNNSGIDFNRPIYAYANKDETTERLEAVAVAAVHDADKVDRFMELANSIAEANDAMPVIVKRKGDTRIVSSDDPNVCVGYNNELFVVVTEQNENGDTNNCQALFEKALNTPYADLTMFGKRDMAMYADYDRLLDIVQYIGEQEGTYNDIPTEIVKKFNEFRAAVGENATLISGLTFLDGRATLDGEIKGVDTTKYAYLGEVTNNHLSSLPDTLLGMFNLNMKGDLLVDYLRAIPVDTLAEITGVDQNELNTAMQIAFDAIGSIDGDVTLSLNSIDGNYYGVQSAEALVLADVKDDYIISNIAMFGSQFLTRTSENNYTIRLGHNLSLYTGQNENVFYAGVNDDNAPESESATNARWIDDIKNSNYYLVIDVENIMSNGYIATLWNMAAEDMSEYDYTTLSDAIDMTDYIYAKGCDNSMFELCWVLDNSETNALKQIVNNLIDFSDLLQ